MADTDLLRNDGTRVRVGDRIQFESHFGTVQYVGDVTAQKGVWLGIDWDEPDRGKHNGSHEGKVYFQTRFPQSGSFIRPKKVQLGVSMIFALKDRYGLVEEGDAGVKTEDLYVLGSNMQTTVVEMVGAKKVNLQQSKLETLKDIGLRDSQVYGNGPGNELKQFCPNITELNLSKNLLPSWDEVARITEQLSLLQTLNLSENCLLLPADPEALKPCFTRVKSLFLNQMEYNWNQILTCTSMFPQLEQLHVCYNKLDSLFAPPESQLQHLKLLNLDCNNLSDWSQILNVGLLPCLETLLVSENKISMIQFPDEPSNKTTKYFSKVHTMFLMRNTISEFSPINELAKLKTLTDLKLQGNPLWKAEGLETVREVVIAKIKTLKMCSSTKISEGERKGSELDYLKMFGNEWKKAGGHQDPAENKPNEEFTKQHPRYQELIDKWGAPEDSELVVKTSAIKDSLLEVVISCPMKPDMGLIKKKLPKTMSILKLKTLVRNVFKVDSNDIYLSYESQQMKGREIDLDNDFRQISFFSIEHGDTVIVSYK